MNASADLLRSVFANASKSGVELAPERLLTVISVLDDPLHGLMGDLGREMFEAIRGEFPFVHFVRDANQPPSEDDLANLAALLRWTIREFVEWREADDLQLKKLTALFVVAWFCEVNDTFWQAFPDGLAANKDLLGRLERLISQCSMSLSARGSMEPPIWEGEAVDAFRKADESGDWVAIADGWRLIEHSQFPNLIVAHSVRCLSRFDLDRLLQAIANQRQIVIAMAIAQTLSASRALEVGTATDNPYFQFAAAYQATSGRRNGSELDIDGQDFLTVLLIKVADDEPRWAAWMRIFNRISSWFPALQIPLGRALAIINESSVSAYIDTINLCHTGVSHTASSGGRKNVSVCLRAFRKAASYERRKLLWELAYKRWQAWRFGGGDANDHLLEVCTSELDYAVIGYVCECLDDLQRTAALEALTRKLNAIDNGWHSDVMACISEWNRILSEFQPYAQAEDAIRNNKSDWLAEEKHYLPDDPGVNLYVVMKFGMQPLTVQSA